jgi:hypothetical protein
VKPLKTLAPVSDTRGLFFDLLPGQLTQPGFRRGDKLATREDSFGDDLRSGAGSCRSNVRNKIANCEINFMPHRISILATSSPV